VREELIKVAERARAAALELAKLGRTQKDRALLAMADALEEREEEIVKANAVDMERGEREGLSRAVLDRLLLNGKRVREMAAGLRHVASLPDPVGEVMEGWTLPNGLVVTKVRVPLGVVGVIYEARPNVTVDAAGLCVKSGNACLLRGSASAYNSNQVLARIVEEAGVGAGLPEGSVQLAPGADHETAREMMRLHGYIDALIPRGGASLIRTVVEESRVPVIETGIGNCHVYVDRAADLEKALRIVVNAKTQRPAVCNAAETLLVHEAVAERFLPLAAQALEEKGVELRGCERTRAILPGAKPATEEDWYAEYLDLILAVKVVSSVEEAVDHINRYGSKHTEAIVTEDLGAARAFTQGVDSAALFVNASTRFTDGGEFGFGAEIGISTQKLHARGPMALKELTTYKYVVWGEGQVRE
jgi:glutamate-5-semialdehyde dehydrogenase